MTQNFKLKSKLSVDACMANLIQNTDPDRPWTNVLSKHQFKSSIDGCSFRVQRKKLFRDSFAPIFSGSVSSNGSETLISGGFVNTYNLKLILIALSGMSIAFCLVLWSVQPLLYAAVLAVAIGFIAITGEPDQDAILVFIKQTMKVEEG